MNKLFNPKPGSTPSEHENLRSNIKAKPLVAAGDDLLWVKGLMVQITQTGLDHLPPSVARLAGEFSETPFPDNRDLDFAGISDFLLDPFGHIPS